MGRLLKLRPHQQRFINSNPDKAFLVWAMRTGKSLPAKLWSEHSTRNSNAIIICLKSNKKDWIELCPNGTVHTKEEFKKYVDTIENPSCVVVDEAHNFFAPLFTKQRSKQAECLYNFIKKSPDIHVLLLTATPLTNNPYSLHTALCYLGMYMPWKDYRAKMFTLESRPYLKFPAWMAKSDWRETANRGLEKYADIVSLRDCVGSLPPVSEEVIHIKTPLYKYALGEERRWQTDHLQEQSLKHHEIRKLGYRKVIVVCHFTAQIDALESELIKDRPVYVLDGRTKDQSDVKRQAQEAHDCYFIVQAKMGMGWDGYMFDAMVFASMSHRVIDYTQMLGRLTSVDNPSPCIYYYLLGGKWDRKIYQSVKLGEDFNIHNHDTTRLATEE